MAKHPWPNETFLTRACMRLRAKIADVSHGFPKSIGNLVQCLASVFPDQNLKWKVSSRYGEEPYHNEEFEATCDGALGRSLTKIARDAQLIIHASFHRGRGELSRRPLSFTWMPAHGEPGTWWLSIELELSDVLPDHFRAVRGVIDAFFGGLPETGTVQYAHGTLRPIRPRWPVEDDSTQDYEPPIESAENAGFYGAVPPGTIEALTWLTLLGPQHLKSLGGRESFLARAKQFARELDLKDPLARPIGPAHALVELPIWAEPWLYPTDPKNAEDLRTSPEPSRWFARELADARLFAWQTFSRPKVPDLGKDRAHIVPLSPATNNPVRLEQPPQSTPQSSNNDLWARLQDNPPECFLHEPAMATIAERNWAQREYGQFATAFIVANDRGRTALPLWVRLSTDSMMATDPIIVGHPSRQGASFIFQSHRHGFNGKQGHNHWPRRKAPDLFHCPRCGKDKFRVLAVFQYSGDEDDGADPRMERSPQDFFSWLAVRATCSECKWTGTIADIECA